MKGKNKLAKKKESTKSDEKSKTKKIKRYLTSIIGLPIVAIFFIFANNLVMDIALGVLAILMMYEYINCFRSTKKANPSAWICYLCCMLIPFTHFISERIRAQILVTIIPIIIFALFVELIFSNGKKNIIDIAVTVLGILYIPLCVLFVSLLRGLEPSKMGKIYAGFLFATSWGSDGLAYIVGTKIGKHKLTPISPKKTVEGAVAGIIGSIFCLDVFAIGMNLAFGLKIGIWQITLISIILGIIGQIGDISASAIKRYCGIKDFSEVLPGHGGFLDRLDSLLFIAPFAYFLLQML